MQFFKVEGFMKNPKWAEENEDRRVMHERARFIETKAQRFNQKMKEDSFFFVADASDDVASIGVFQNGKLDFEKKLDEFLDEVGLELRDVDTEEVTLSIGRDMIRCANRNGYLRDEDEVLEHFDIDKIHPRFGGIDFGENVIVPDNKERLCEKASKLLSKDCVLEELERIYAGNTHRKIVGHPVHYMVESDDHDTRNAMYQALIHALYNNGRIASKRYTYLDVAADDDFSSMAYDFFYKSNIGGTVVVRYMSKDVVEDDFANGGRDVIEKLCRAMKKYNNQVQTIFCLPRECSQAKAIFFENLTNISFVELKEDFSYGQDAVDYLKLLAKEQNIRPDKKLTGKVEENIGYLAPDLQNIFEIWYNDKLKNGIYPQYKEVTRVSKQVKDAAPKGSAIDELNEMIGLSEAKSVIKQALDYFKAQKLFAEKGMSLDRPSMHMVFTGNPGTAKTTVARLFASIMKDNALLSKGHLVEVGRGDLVGKFVGWTAPTIKKKFREAEGGVLFIDEAYSLVDDRDGSFGDEAINTIVQEMENHRNDMVVIFAGYPDKMEKFLQKNPGLRSRIAFHVPFADYDANELCEIANLIAKKKSLKLSEETVAKLNIVFEIARHESDFGNGRYVRNIIEKAKMAQASRLLTMDIDNLKKEDIMTILPEDVEIPKASGKQSGKIGFCA